MKLYVQRHSTLVNRLEKAMRLVEKDKKGWWDIIRPKIRRTTSSQKSTLTSSSTTSPAASDAEDGESEDPENDPETDFEGVWPNTKEPDKDYKAGSRRSKKSDKGQKPPVKYSQKEWDDWHAGKRTCSDDAATKKLVPRTQAEELEQILIALGEKVGSENPDLEKLQSILDRGWRQTLLPDTFTGWLLLQRSGLAPTERATVLATSGGLELKAIDKALREQWNDSELKERDGRSKDRSREYANNLAGSDGDSTEAPEGEHPDRSSSDDDREFVLESDLSDA
jgi:hypothetical protein